MKIYIQLIQKEDMLINTLKDLNVDYDHTYIVKYKSNKISQQCETE